jgi:hypothetical protein
MAIQALIKTEFKNVVEETFSIHHGMYTNRGTSLFETLATISSEKASQVRGQDQETIAGHVFHLKFYLIVTQEYMTGQRTGHTDWDQSWVVKDVTADQWNALKDELYAEYRKLMAFIDGVEDWGQGDYFSGLVGIVAHNAFHLAAIRELNTL